MEKDKPYLNQETLNQIDRAIPTENSATETEAIMVAKPEGTSLPPASQELPIKDEKMTGEPEKKETKKHRKFNRAVLKASLISIIGLLALRGGSEVADDIVRAKNFIEKSGYTTKDYTKDVYGDVLFYEGEQTIMVNQPTTAGDIVASRFGLIGENVEKAEDHIAEINKDNPDIFLNNIGEIGPGSKVKAPAQIEAKSPISALVEYAFGDSSDDIDYAPGLETNQEKLENNSTINPEQTENSINFPNELGDYTIKAGDSLWSIANELFQNAGLQSDQESMEATINYLKAINHLDDDIIKAGDKLNVPTNPIMATKIANSNTPSGQDTNG